MHRPLIQVTAVIVSHLAGRRPAVGTVLECCCPLTDERAPPAVRGGARTSQTSAPDETRPATTAATITHGLVDALVRRRRPWWSSRRAVVVVVVGGAVVVVVVAAADGRREGHDAVRRRGPGGGLARPTGSGSGWRARRSWPGPGRPPWTGRARRGRRSGRWSRRAPPRRSAGRRRPTTLHRRWSPAGEADACTAIGAAQAGEVDGRAHDGDATVDVVCRRPPERRLLAPDPAEGRSRRAGRRCATCRPPRPGRRRAGPGRSTCRGRGRCRSGHEDGAKYWRSVSDGESSSTESLSS